jgi:hypothetical protein
MIIEVLDVAFEENNQNKKGSCLCKGKDERGVVVDEVMLLVLSEALITLSEPAFV